MPNAYLYVEEDKFKTQHIDKLKNTLCEKSQSVFFLLFLLAKVDVKV